MLFSFIFLVNYTMVNKLYLDDNINKLDSNDIYTLIIFIDFKRIYICVHSYFILCLF